MSLRKDELRRLLSLIDATRAREIDCTEFLHRVAPFVERWKEEGRPPEGPEEIVQHLRVCPECLEEVEALLTILGEGRA